MSTDSTTIDASPSADAGGAGSGQQRKRGLHLLFRYGVFAVYVIMFAVFSILKPGAFLQVDTMKSILSTAAILAVVAAALTLVLAVGEFDLSFGSVAGISGAVAIYSMTSMHLPIVVAIVAAIVVGVIAGALNGTVVAYGKVPALIATLAVGSVALGLERAIFRDNTVYDGIPESYASITGQSIAGIASIVWISILAAIAISLVASFTVFGRRIYATGGSDEAARIAGIRTRRVRVLTFVFMGALAAVAGILLTSQAASYYPNSGSGLLLPAYAACFLGWSAAGADRFYPAYTYFGVLFIGTLSSGLIILQVPSWVTDLVQGLVLVSAVLLARAAKSR